MRKLIAGLAVLGFGIGTAAAAGLDVTLAEPLAKSDFGSGKIRYALTNHTDRTLHVLRWQTPLDGMTGRLFEVTRNGQPVAYEGILHKRAAPTADDYVELGPGATLDVEVDLTAYYDMKAGGRYEVRYARDARDVILEVNRGAKASLESGYLAFDRAAVTSIHVDAAPDAFDPPMPRKQALGVLAATTSFVGCSTTRKNQIATARTAGLNYANDAKNYLNANTQGSRYTWWFGTVQSARYATATSHFNDIHNAFATQPFTIDCNCNSSVYAYVNPGNPYYITVCRAFWSAPMTGTDSKAGTLVHEVSHFDVVGGTDDYAYGQTNAHNLALNAPSNAVMNADSHEYFAENTPPRN